MNDIIAAWQTIEDMKERGWETTIIVRKQWVRVQMIDINRLRWVETDAFTAAEAIHRAAIMAQEAVA